MSKIDELLKNYEDTKAGIKPSQSSSTSGTTPKLDKLQKMYHPTKAEEAFRVILPNRAESYFEEAYFHSAKVNGQYKKLYCRKKNDGLPCAMCDQHEADMQAYFDAKHEKGSQASKDGFKAANLYQPDKFYIFKGLDKQRLADGLKFWRLKAARNNDGDFDKVLSLVGKYKRKTGNDFTDPLKGFDFEIEAGTKKMPTGKEYVGIKDIAQGEKSLLAMVTKGDKLGEPDEEKIAEYLNDTLTWRDVFTAPSIRNLLDEYEYLKAVMEDRVPRWDEGLKRFVVKGADGVDVVIDLRQNGAEAKVNTGNGAAEIKISKESLHTATSTDSDLDDLPF